MRERFCARKGTVLSWCLCVRTEAEEEATAKHIVASPGVGDGEEDAEKSDVGGSEREAHSNRPRP